MFGSQLKYSSIVEYLSSSIFLSIHSQAPMPSTAAIKNPNISLAFINVTSFLDSEQNKKETEGFEPSSLGFRQSKRSSIDPRLFIIVCEIFAKYKTESPWCRTLSLFGSHIHHLTYRADESCDRNHASHSANDKHHFNTHHNVYLLSIKGRVILAKKRGDAINITSPAPLSVSPCPLWPYGVSP